MKKIIFLLFFSVLFFWGYGQQSSSSWSTTGNSNITNANFFGSIGNVPLIFRTNNVERMRLLGDNPYLGIGITTPKAPLHLHTNITTLPSGISNIKLLQLTTTLTGSGESNGLIMYYSDVSGFTFKQNDFSVNFNLEGYGGGLSIAPDGNIGMGTTRPRQKLHIVDGNILISKTSAKAAPGGSPNGSIFFGATINNNFPNGKWGIEYLDGEDNCYGLNFWRPWNPGGGGYSNYTLFLANSDKVGIGTNDPQAKLDVNGSLKALSANITGALSANALNASSAMITGNLSVKEGFYNLSLGDASGQNLSYGTSYIGFNATRNNGIWSLAGDRSNNGGSVIWGAVDGSILFASIPTTGGINKTLTDTQIKENIKLWLNPNGKLKAKEVEVTLANWPDFVFEDSYDLLSLSEIEQYIKQNHRLPNIPSAKEVEENGVNLGDMQGKLLQKVEELTLYIIEQEKQMKELEKRLSEIENERGGE